MKITLVKTLGTSWKWAGIKFWIITDAGHEIITVLLPEEY